MSNTYTQIYIQIVFAVQRRENLIQKSFRDELQKYICGIIEKRNTKPLAIYCMPDHTHILIGLKPNINISDLVRDIKAGSSKLINDNKWVKGKFEWQTGFGAFSYGHTQLNLIINYINNQEEHHRTKKFRHEYISLLKNYEVDYNEAWLFDDV